MGRETQTIKKRYDRIAPLFHRVDGKMMRSWRKELLSGLSGDVLEVGIGTGANLSYYPPTVRLTGIDFSPKMLQYAEQRAKELKIDVTLMEMDAQNLTFEDQTFDYIVATCVFCSVPDPVQGMREMKRVCNKEGEIRLLEHMRSEHPMVGKLMDLLNPLTVRISGANINRYTLKNVESAGLIIQKSEPLCTTIVRRLLLRP